MAIDNEIVARVWSGAEAELRQAVVAVDRTEDDEVSVDFVNGDGEKQFVYLTRDRAVRLAQALVFEASKQWPVP